MSTTYGFWPTPAQTLLLRAALLDAAPARDAYEAWESTVVVDRLDVGSIQLLPLLYENLRHQGIEARATSEGRLRGVYRQSWYKNQMLLGALGELLERFADAKIPTLVLKGVPLGLCYYPNLAARPMTDIDIVIPPGLAAEALAIALASGLCPRFPAGDWPPRMAASRSFAHPDGWECNLRTHVMHECRGPHDDDLWAAARSLTVASIPTLMLAPEDQVLDVLVHAVRRNALPPVRWVADVALVLRSEGTAFDWTRLWEQARKRRASLVVREALRYVHEQSIAAIPESALVRFAQIRIGLGERSEYRSRMIPGTAGRVAGVLSDYLRARNHARDWRGPFGFVRYMKDRLHSRSMREETRA